MKTWNRFQSILLFTGLMILMTGCYDDTLNPLSDFTVRGAGSLPGFKTVFDASSSQSMIEGNGKLMYRWDLKGDHDWSDKNWESSAINIVLLSGDNFTLSGFIGLQICDSEGKISELYKTVLINYDLYTYTIGEELIKDSVQKWIDYTYYEQKWSYKNVSIPSEEGITNQEGNSFGSYFTWDRANEKISSFMILPSLKDWEGMIDQYGSQDVAGYNMSLVVNRGLSLKYGGKYEAGILSGIGESGYYWTSTQADDKNAYAIKVTKGEDRAEIVTMPKESRLSVRLFKNYSTIQNN